MRVFFITFFVWQFFIKSKSLICQLLDEGGLGKGKKKKKLTKQVFSNTKFTGSTSDIHTHISLPL